MSEKKVNQKEQSQSDNLFKEQANSKKTKTRRKFGPRKKTTKIIHTFCCSYIKANGEIAYLTHQKITDSSNQIRKELTLQAEKSAQLHSLFIIKSYFESYDPNFTNIHQTNFSQFKNLSNCLFRSESFQGNNKQ